MQYQVRARKIKQLGKVIQRAEIRETTGGVMNNQIAGWPVAHPPENWMKVRARWIRFHILRTLVSVPALLSYFASVMLLSGGRTLKGGSGRGASRFFYFFARNPLKRSDSGRIKPRKCRILLGFIWICLGGTRALVESRPQAGQGAPEGRRSFTSSCPSRGP